VLEGNGGRSVVVPCNSTPGRHRHAANQGYPAYSLHKPTGQARVRIGGTDHYLGTHGSEESKQKYEQIVRRLITDRAKDEMRARVESSSDLTINELVVRYLHFVDGYYTSNEPANIRHALRPLRRLYGFEMATGIGPLKLKAVRHEFIAAGRCRSEINKRIRRVVRMFKWAAAGELVPASVHHALKAVEGLRKGRGDVRESKPVKPVPDAFVDAIRPHVPRQVWAMIELQRLSGMRPGEVCIMRTTDISMAGRIWEFTPETHKTEHFDRERTIFIGPQAQEILRPWLRAELEAYLFQPREADVERRAAMRLARKSKVQPSQRNRRKIRPRKGPGERYDPDSYRRAIAAACDRAFPHPTVAPLEAWDLPGPERDEFRRLRKSLEEKGLPAGRRREIRAAIDALLLPPDQRAELIAWRKAHRWHPHQLRHNAATRLRREFGLDVARAVLGHSTPVVTEIYAELDRSRAAEAMGMIG
jgi:integrase